MSTLRFGDRSQHTTVDEEERDARRLAARRARAEERRERFLDPLLRTAGKDLAALEAQMAEKARRAEEAKEADRREAEEHARAMRAVAAHEAAIAEEKRRRAAELTETRARQVESRTLQSSGRMVAGVTAKIGHEHGTAAALAAAAPEPAVLGPSSMRVFDGADPRAVDRAALQSAQLREWARAAEREKEAERAAKAAEEAEFNAKLREALAVRAELEKEAELAALERKRAVMEENRRLALERAEERARAERVRKVEEEVLSTTGPPHLLDEDPADATSMLGSHRVRVDHFRGMTPAMRAKFEREAAEHAAAREAAKAAEREAEARFVAEQRRAAAEAARLEAAIQAEREAAQRAFREEAARQAEEARRLREERERGRKEPTIRPEFFARFGTSDR